MKVEAFIRRPEQQVKRPYGEGTGGTLEGQKDGNVNAERKHLSGSENCPVKRILAISEEADGEMEVPWSEKQQVRGWLWAQGGL